MGRRNAALLALPLLLFAPAASASPEGSSARAEAPLPWPAVGRLGGERRVHGDSIHRLSWSGDSKRIRTWHYWENDRLVEWEVDRTEPVAVHRAPAVEKPKEHSSWRLALSADGSRMAACLSDHGLRLVETATGKVTEPFAVPSDHLTWDAVDLAWSPDGGRVAMCESDGSVLVWEIASGKLLWRVRIFPNRGSRLAWSPDGKAIAAAGSGDMEMDEDRRAGWSTGRFAVLDAADGTRLFEDAKLKRAVSGVAFSPDGRLVAVVAEWDNESPVYDWRAGKRLYGLPGSGGDDGEVSFSADGTRLVTGSRAGLVRVWKSADGSLDRTFEAPQAAECVAWSPDGRWIACGGESGTLWIFDAADGCRVTPGSGHASEVQGIAWSRHDGRIATAGRDGTVILWDAEKLRPGTVLRPAPGKDGGQAMDVTGVAWSPEDRLLAATRGDGSTSIFDPGTGKETAVLVPPPVEKGSWIGAATSPRFSPDGKRLAVGSNDPQARLWDAKEWRFLRLLDSGAGSVTILGWDLVGARLFGHGIGTAGVAYDFGGVCAWDASSGKAASDAATEWKVEVAALSPDGSRIATVEEDSTVRVFDAATLAPLARRDGPLGGAETAAFSADGVWVATGCTKGWVVIHDAATLTRLLAMRTGEDPVIALGWSPRGDRLVSAERRGLVPVWDLYPATRPEAAARASLPEDGEARGRVLGALWNRLGDPRLDEGLAAEEELAALGAAGAAFVENRVRRAASVSEAPPDARVLRALRALARSRAPEASAVLRGLASGAEGAPLTRTADSCLRASVPGVR